MVGSVSGLADLKVSQGVLATQYILKSSPSLSTGCADALEIEVCNLTGTYFDTLGGKRDALPNGKKNDLPGVIFF
jgi:hypothetical protein